MTYRKAEMYLIGGGVEMVSVGGISENGTKAEEGSWWDDEVSRRFCYLNLMEYQVK